MWRVKNQILGVIGYRRAFGKISVRRPLAMTRASSLTVRFCSFSTYNFPDSKDDDLKMPDYDEETKAKISGKLKGY